MTIETAKQTVDFIIKNTQKGDEIIFGLFGGEPLLRFDQIEKITEYIKKETANAGFRNRISITTNGTLLTEKTLEFIKKHDISLCISIDGPEEVHNKYRVYKNGRGSFKKVYENIKLTREILDFFQVNAVYGPDTIEYLPETAKLLVGLKVPAIHLNLNITSDWSKTPTNIFSETYKKIGDLYIKNYQDGNEVTINIIDNKVILLLKGGFSEIDVCGMGETELGISPAGNLYPCERLIGEDNSPKFFIGNVYDGFDTPRLEKVIANRGNAKEECKSCKYEPYCMSWCGCTNYHMSGQTNQPSITLCASEKAMIQNAMYVLKSLNTNDLFVDHYYNCLINDLKSLH